MRLPFPVIPLLAGFVALSSFNLPAFAQGGTMTNTIGVPKYKVGPPPSPPIVYVVWINGVKITATVPNLDPQKKSPPAETPAQASQRKAAVIVAALNVGINAAIAAGKLPAGTPLATVATEPATVPNVDKDGKPRPGPAMVPNTLAGYGIVKVEDVTEVGPGNRDPSGEGNGHAIIKKKKGTNVGAAGMMGPGFAAGAATGVDGETGGPSFVSFGVLDPSGHDAGCAPELPPVSTCPGAFIATVFPSAGANDGMVLGGLAALFNSLYAGDGLSVTYDPLADLLFLDFPLNELMTLFTQNTDLGLDLVPVLKVVPEPASLAMLGLGLAGILAIRRRRNQPGAAATACRRRPVTRFSSPARPFPCETGKRPSGGRHSSA